MKSGVLVSSCFYTLCMTELFDRRLVRKVMVMAVFWVFILCNFILFYIMMTCREYCVLLIWNIFNLIFNIYFIFEII